MEEGNQKNMWTKISPALWQFIYENINMILNFICKKTYIIR